MTRENQETIRINVPFEHGGKQLFLAEVEMKKNAEERTLHSLKFFSFEHKSFCSDIRNATLIIGKDQKSSTHQQITMTEAGTDDEELLKIFNCHAILEIPLVNFINKSLDSTRSEQLWDVAVNKKIYGRRRVPRRK